MPANCLAWAGEQPTRCVAKCSIQELYRAEVAWALLACLQLGHAGAARAGAAATGQAGALAGSLTPGTHLKTRVFEGKSVGCEVQSRWTAPACPDQYLEISPSWRAVAGLMLPAAGAQLEQNAAPWWDAWLEAGRTDGQTGYIKSLKPG